MANKLPKESGEERVTAKSKPLMNLSARMPSVVSSSTSSSPEKRFYGNQDPWRSVVANDRSGQPDKLSSASHPKLDHDRAWSSQEWKSGVAAHDRSGKLEKTSSSVVQQVRPHHGDTLLDGDAQSVRYGGMLRDRSGQLDNVNSQDVADSENFVMGSDAGQGRLHTCKEIWYWTMVHLLVQVPKKWFSMEENSPQGIWDHIAEEMLLEFAESGCPFFRATTPLSMGNLLSKGHGKLSIHFIADEPTIDSFERRFGQPVSGPIIPFGSLVEYHPITAKDQSRIHQFGKKVLPGLFLGYALYAGGEFGRVTYGSQTLRSWRRWTHRKSTQKDSMRKR